LETKKAKQNKTTVFLFSATVEHDEKQFFTE
jgi:hypothetical protein